MSIQLISSVYFFCDFILFACVCVFFFYIVKGMKLGYILAIF